MVILVMLVTLLLLPLCTGFSPLSPGGLGRNRNVGGSNVMISSNVMTNVNFGRFLMGTCICL